MKGTVLGRVLRTVFLSIHESAFRTRHSICSESAIKILASVFLISAAMDVGSMVQAQQVGTIRRIGYLFTGFHPPKEFSDAVGKLGYIEGKNIVYENRSAEGREDRLPELAADLVRLNVDVIVAPGAAAGLAAKGATKTIPVVYMGGGDPVDLGIVNSLARPGGNVTGVTEISPELTGKRLELLRESFPKIAIVAVLVRTGAPGISDQLRRLETVAKGLSLKLQLIEVRAANEFEKSFSKFTRSAGTALIELPNPLFHANRKPIVEFAVKNRLPTIFHSKDFVEAGGLMAYGADFADLYRRAAVYVDKILKGAKPADLPVEQPMKFEFIVNLKAAKQIGVTIPPNVLVRADRVIR
jgi:putative tryptophan/tyrosine transport system substrate-binding protein